MNGPIPSCVMDMSPGQATYEARNEGSRMGVYALLYWFKCCLDDNLFRIYAIMSQLEAFCIQAPPGRLALSSEQEGFDAKIPNNKIMHLCRDIILTQKYHTLCNKLLPNSYQEINSFQAQGELVCDCTECPIDWDVCNCDRCESMSDQLVIATQQGFIAGQNFQLDALRRQLDGSLFVQSGTISRLKDSRMSIPPGMPVLLSSQEGFDAKHKKFQIMKVCTDIVAIEEYDTVCSKLLPSSWTEYCSATGFLCD